MECAGRALAVSLVLATTAGCYRSHVRGETDAGRDAPDAGRDAPDAPTCVPHIDRVRVEGAHTYSIDRTEVTQADYARFLACAPPSTCGGVSPEPGRAGRFRPDVTPTLPVTDMPVCAAFLYCAWAGGRVCDEGTEMRPVCEAVVAAIVGDGDYIVRDEGACVLGAYADGDWDASPADGLVPVGTASRCHPRAAPGVGVLDVLGNASEVAVSPAGTMSAGGSYHLGARLFHGCAPPVLDGPWDASFHSGTVGIRCCAD